MRKPLTFLVASLLSVSALASADNSGFYLGANAGNLGGTISKDVTGNDKDEKFNARSFGLNAGYQVNDWFSIEGRINKANSYKKGGVELSNNYNLGLYSKFSMNVTDKAYLYGLAGVSNVKYGLKGHLEDPKKTEHHRQFKPSLGVGVGYDITNNLTVSADYINYAVGKKKPQDLQLGGFNLSVNYRF